MLLSLKTQSWEQKKTVKSWFQTLVIKCPYLSRATITLFNGLPLEIGVYEQALRLTQVFHSASWQMYHKLVTTTLS